MHLRGRDEEEGDLGEGDPGTVAFVHLGGLQACLTDLRASPQKSQSCPMLAFLL